jgi:hypothetical protein
MKKSTALAAVPVAIALLSLGVPGKSMATDIAVPVAVASHGSEATAVSAQDNLNTKDSNNTEYNAKAVNGSAASNTGDATIQDIKVTKTATETKGNATAALLAVVGDISLNASVAALSNEVSGNRISFGNDLENENGFIANHNRSSNTVSLDTGKNSISGRITADGITPIAMNTGIQSSIQQQVNVQAFTGKSGK